MADPSKPSGYFALPEHDSHVNSNITPKEEDLAILHESVGNTDRYHTPVPLVCTICPKNTRFSDVSHLLTHVSSKGHLSVYFALTVVKDTDPDAAWSLAQYDQWYTENDINSLLRERMQVRTQRQLRQQGQRPGSKPSSGRGTGQSRGGKGGGRGSKLRPRHSDGSTQDYIKHESDDNADMDSGYGVEDSPSWQSSGNLALHSHVSHSFLERYDPGDSENEDDTSFYDTSENGSYVSYGSCLNSENTSEIIDLDAKGPILRLKGARYPGMGGFDAASEEQRRKRNQRKDPAVLQQLEDYSRAVTTEEIVFDQQLGLQRTRDVFDEISVDGSDLEIVEEQEVSEEKKRKPRTNSATRGVGRGGNRGGTKKKGRRAAPKEETERNPNKPQSRQSSRTKQSSRESAETRAGRLQMPQLQPAHPQLPLHSHDMHGPVNVFGTPDIRLSHPGGHSGLPYDQRRRHERLPGLALRPGNPNLSFANSSPNLKHSTLSPLYPGKENGQLSFHTAPSTSNPYLSPNVPIENTGNYNPLCVQPRDSSGFRAFPSFEDEIKAEPNGFHPANNHGGFGNMHMPHHHGEYHPDHPADNPF